MTPLRIEATKRARLDETISVVVHSRGGTEVTVRAETEDARGRSWSSQATFLAGADGRIELGKASPSSDDYSSNRPMAFVESMRLASEPPSLFYDGAGHTMNPPFVPSTVSTTMHPLLHIPFAFGGEPAAQAIANEDSWPADPGVPERRALRR